MFISISKAAVTGLALLALIYPQVSEAETFTSGKFLTWPQDSQDFYIRTSIGMAGLIIRQSNAADGDCVDRWYFSAMDQRNRMLKKIMTENPRFHPHGIILGVLQKECGSFDYGS